MGTYKVSCGHPGCGWSTQVEIDGDVSSWQPAQESAILDIDGNPIVTPWSGQPIDDAYFTHFQQVHATEKLPPMCNWALVE